MSREKVKKELLELNAKAYGLWVHDQKNEFLAQIGNVTDDVLALLKEQEVKEQISDAIHETAKQFRQTIVRCKDCKHYRYYGLSAETVSECTMNHCENPDEDWFCADGERQEGRCSSK